MAIYKTMKGRRQVSPETVDQLLLRRLGQSPLRLYGGWQAGFFLAIGAQRVYVGPKVKHRHSAASGAHVVAQGCWCRGINAALAVQDNTIACGTVYTDQPAPYFKADKVWIAVQRGE